jgi:hypothetical protein
MGLNHIAYIDCDGHVFVGDALLVVALLLEFVLGPDAAHDLDALSLLL